MLMVVAILVKAKMSGSSAFFCQKCVGMDGHNKIDDLPERGSENLVNHDSVVEYVKTNKYLCKNGLVLKL